MRKTIFIIILILINLNCSSNFKSIDKKVYKVEKTIEKSQYSAQNLCLDCSPEIDALIYFTKIENQIKKINFEINSHNGCKEYSKKITIYLENNIPILITEIENGICEYQMTGIDKRTKKLIYKQESKISSDIKIYISDWQKFEIIVVGGSKLNYNLRTKEKYEKIVNGILKQEKLK